MAPAASSRTLRSKTGTIVASGAAFALVVAMAIDTTVIPIDSGVGAQSGAFSPEEYGAAQFPDIQTSIETRAVEAAELAQAIAADRDAAVEQYGVPAGAAPVMAVKFTGTVGEGRSGNYDVAVEGLPEDLRVRVQTGPAINGTDLRDATGNIQFGDFTNQIEYQNAGSAINNAMKGQVLAGLDTASLTGRTLSVVGVFRLVNPKSWLVTPVRLSVE